MGEAIMTKHQTVLKLSDDQPFANCVIFNNADEDGTEEFQLDSDNWEDFGRPTQITVTVEPGDLLNKTTLPVSHLNENLDIVEEYPGNDV